MTVTIVSTRKPKPTPSAKKKSPKSKPLPTWAAGGNSTPRPHWYAAFLDRLISARACSGPDGLQLSQHEVALAAQLEQSQVAQYEAGRYVPSLFAFRKLLLALGVSADALFGLADCPECGRTVEQDEADAHCR